MADGTTQGDTGFISFIVLGASGDLAKKKILPSLFALFHAKHLPKNFLVLGYARSNLTTEQFRESIMARLTCRVGDVECGRDQELFLERCYYVAGKYDDMADFRMLGGKLDEIEASRSVAMHSRIYNRLFYMALPPTVFVPVAAGIAAADAACKRSPTGGNGWTRVIVEKPFGMDLASSREMSTGIAKSISEVQTYRIDHYLGKELVDNLTVLRFSNVVFEPLWNRQYMKSVQILWAEKQGTEGRGGYFDAFGIIRDIMQNHLLQILALFAMEPPVSLDAEDIRNEKVKVLRSMRIVTLDDCAIGQYGPSGQYPGYLDDPTVPKGSLCPTFAAVALFIDNPRWEGVPFLLKAGKALDRKGCEIHAQYRDAPGRLYADHANVKPASNELVIRVQPDEAIFLTVNNKVPGLGLELDKSKLDLQYKAQYKMDLPDAYERLILDVTHGDKRLFIRNDELDAAWEIFSPVLHELESKRIAPEVYAYGSGGPAVAERLVDRLGVKWATIGDETKRPGIQGHVPSVRRGFASSSPSPAPGPVPGVVKL